MGKRILQILLVAGLAALIAKETPGIIREIKIWKM
jgi:hypothetical protein